MKRVKELILTPLGTGAALFLTFLPLRLINLGYSEYICAETLILDYLRTTGRFYSLDFLLNQHKGPVQYLISGLIFLLNHNVYTEFSFRLPIALVSALALPFFYLFVYNTTKNRLVAVISSVMLGVNGFTVAFGRIFQYQSLNIFFSCISLYFFSKVSEADTHKSIYIDTLGGTFFFCLSLLSHWDAIFILPYVLWVIVKYILVNKSYTAKVKASIVLVNAVLAFILLGPFLFLYIRNYLASSVNQVYLHRRVNLSANSIEDVTGRLKVLFFKVKLYNPLVFVWFILVTSAASLFLVKKAVLFFSWFLAELLFVLFVFTNSGTHIYNMLLPLSLLSGLGIVFIYEIVINKIRSHKMAFTVLYSSVIFCILGFLYYQSYILFVNHTPEYPFSGKSVLAFPIQGVSKNEEKYFTNIIIGFTFHRNWKEISSVLDDYEKQNGIPIHSLPIETNEITCPAEFYTNRSISPTGKRFVVGVKNPMSFQDDYKNFSREGKKDLLTVIKNKSGDTLAKIYTIRATSILD